jgi:5,10-methylene-tetrahydrofolate dehydrogenase/methenyl tetrahydrofolate cyclohydrolase
MEFWFNRHHQNRLMEGRIVRALDPSKDVDGFHPINVAKLALSDGKRICALYTARLSTPP